MFWSGVYRLFWISSFIALMAVGAPMLGKPEATLPLVDRGRDSSVNSVLQPLLGEAELAPRITEWLAGLPRGKPVLILAAPDHMAAALTAGTISYLAWPRATVISTNREQSLKLIRNFREHYGALALCYLPPPPGFTPSKSFGPDLLFILSEPAPE